jgi:VWFA-related protein
MRSTRLLVLLASVLGLALLGSAAQAPQGSSQTRDLPTFAAATNAVTLDVVVRDKRGRMVRDLTAADFEVYEDGVKQAIDSFEVFGLREAVSAQQPAAPSASPAAAGARPSAGSAAAPSPPSPSPAVEQRPQVIAFVFDRLSADARSLALKAALSYLDHGHVPGDLVGVYAIDLALRIIQPVTDAPPLIRVALQRAAAQANTPYSADRAAARDLIENVTLGQQAGEAATGVQPSGSGAAAQGQQMGATAAAGALNQAISSLQVQMLRSFEALERDQQGFATTNGLLAVVNGLRSLPGRKTVVFFSEGLAIPPNVQAQFRSVIHTANRANVSVYAMDAAGLRSQSVNEEARQEMLQAAARRRREIESGIDDATGGSMIRALERNEDLLRLNPHSGLGQLAAETGGFLIRDTNDAASEFRRIQEEMRFQYLLGYTPTNDSYDGRFREIMVKVKRPAMQVQTRQGYYAVRAADAKPLKTYEAPALAQLERSQRPAAFPLHAAALNFPEPERPGLAPVLVRVPGNVMTYKADKDGEKLHRADFTILVRIKDEAGREVDRLSQRYQLSAAATDLERARRGDVLFYRQATLPPGRYRLEAVGYDGYGDRASVSTTTLEVKPPAGSGLRLSSIVLISRAEKLSDAERQSDNPLFYGETVLYPSLGEPFRKSASPAIGFFFTVYGASGASSRKASIEVLRGGQVAGRVTADLPAPDAAGKIQFAGALPVQSFAPGTYELKVTVGEGAGSDTQQARFTLAE